MGLIYTVRPKKNYTLLKRLPNKKIYDSGGGGGTFICIESS